MTVALMPPLEPEPDDPKPVDPPCWECTHPISVHESVMTDDEDMCPNCVTPWKCNGPHGFSCYRCRTEGGPCE